MDGLSRDDPIFFPAYSAFPPDLANPRRAADRSRDRAETRITSNVREETRVLGDVLEITEIEERRIEENGRIERLPNRTIVRTEPLVDEGRAPDDPGGILDLFA